MSTGLPLRFRLPFRPRPAPTLRFLSAEELLPAKWLRGTEPSRCWVFNPSIAVHAGEWLLAYRVALPDLRRRMAVCRLDRDLEVIPGSVVPLSDLVVDGGDWHADPRLCPFGDRLLLHFNNGARVPNDIFLVEIDPDTLRPVGPCRTVELDRPRRPVEKNWMFFEHDDRLHAVYSIAPHRVDRVHLDAPGPVRCTSCHEIRWDDLPLTSRYGPPRGSAPPIRVGDLYYSFFHVRYRENLVRRLLGVLRGRSLRTFDYGTGAYAFRAEPPFVPEACTPEPLFDPPPRPPSPRASLSRGAASALYVSGAVPDGDDWIVSAGFHDDGCVLMRLRHAGLLSALRHVSREPGGQEPRDSREVLAEPS